MVLFEQNSPFFAKNVSDFRTQTDVLGCDLIDLILQTKRFCKNAQSQALSAISLGEHFVRIGKNCPKCDPFLMEKLQVAFTTVAETQKLLINKIQSSFLDPLDTFYCENVTKLQLLESEYQARCKSYDGLVTKYLLLSDGKGAFDLFETSSSRHNGYMSHTELAKRSLEIAQEKKSLEMTRYDLMQCMNSCSDKCAFELPSILLSSYEVLQHHYVETVEQLQRDIGDHFVQGKVDREAKAVAYANQLAMNYANRNEMETSLDAMIENVKSNIYTEQTEIFAGSLSALDRTDSTLDGKQSSHSSYSGEDSAPHQSATAQLHRFGTSLMGGFRGSRNSIDPAAKINSQEESRPPLTTPARAKRSNSFVAAFHSVKSPSPAPVPSITDEVSLLAWENKVGSLEYSTLDDHFSCQPHASKNVLKQVILCCLIFYELIMFVIGVCMGASKQASTIS